ncbi:GDSL-type esterase/lipase family protein [Fulvivirga ligni]|uniref:GDSL-type esterase/lipase family protein n=1 Tax=Fulvivirga ligni TaxID=2904246 RepID=UPI001F2C00D6|nr:GDSL-type esterase/lipase family protein [Fulvivirga ligni]UII18959.1 GDSL-type esterase/lipase family protein [Fulvivirga ligni]
MMRKLVMSIWVVVVAISAAQGQIRIVCVGNSITEGWGLRNSITESYPARLGAMLGPNYSVLNCGASGKTMFKNVADTYWTTGKLERAKDFQPDIVVIALGTNDGDSFRWKPHKQEFKGDYLSMMKAFREDGRDPIFILAHCPPLFASEDQNYNISQEVIPIIQQIESEEHTYSVDFYNELINDAKLFPDGVHPGVSGSVKMAQVLRSALSQALISEGKITVNGTHQSANAVEVKVGDKVVLDPLVSGGKWSWRGPNGFTSSDQKIAIKKIQMNQGGFYIGNHTSSAGAQKMVVFRVSVEGCAPSEIEPSMKNGSEWQAVDALSVPAGSNIAFGPQPAAGAWYWEGPNGFTMTAREFSLNAIKNAQEGEYIATYYNEQGCSSTKTFQVEVTGEDVCLLEGITPYIQVEGEWKQQAEISVSQGGTIRFGPHPVQMQTWTWKGPNGFTAKGREITIKDIDQTKEGRYEAFFNDEEGCKDSLEFHVKMKPLTSGK